MSVVNRMLLDIDRRNGAADVQNKGPFPDIRSVPPAAKAPARTPVSAKVLAVAVVALGVTAALLYRAGFLDRAEAVPANAPVPVVARAAPAEPRPMPPSQPMAVVPEPPAVTLPEPAAVAVPQPAALAVAEAPVAPAREVAAKVAKSRPPPAPIESFKLSRQLSPVEDRPAAPRIAPTLSVAPAKTTPLVRQVAADETVAAARALWNEGSRAGALSTLREALALAEGRNPVAATPIARELARLEVADNRPQVALDLLRRFEGPLGDDAEAWALRGNAEQRLALHGESARSYLAALRTRPAEGRWMLGAAISFAADGKLDEAQGWAERARERGAVTPSMETYLQQLGVAARR